MSITAPINDRMLRTDPLFGSDAETRVDRKKNIIHGGAVLQIGEVNDSRPYQVDLGSLQQVVEIINGTSRGSKSRFTHCLMSDDGLGKYLGRWKNARIEGDKAVADLHLSPRSFDSPNGDMGSYILGMAEDEPEAFGVSIVCGFSEEFRNDLSHWESGDDPLPIRLESLPAIDIVDDPAGTRGGFFSNDDLPTQATQLLDHHFADATPEVIAERAVGFLQKYMSHKSGSSARQFQFTLTDDLGAQDMANDDKKIQEAVDTALAKQSTEHKAELDTAVIAAVAETAEKLGGRILSASTIELSPAKLQHAPSSITLMSPEEAVASERERITQLQSLAIASGLADSDKLCQKWIDGDLSVSEAKASVGEALMKQNKLTSGDVNAIDESSDPADKFGKEYDEQKDVLSQMGVDREQYILTRKKDEQIA